MQKHEICRDCGCLLKRAHPQLTTEGAIRDAVGRAVSSEGLITAAAFAIVFGIAVWFEYIALIYVAALVSYYYVIVHHVGDSREGLPAPADVVEDKVGTVELAVRGLLCFAIGFAPLIVWMIAGRPLDDLTRLGLVAVGQLYMPAVVLAVAISNSALDALWPVGWIQIVARAPLAYLRFAVVWLGSIVVGYGLFTVATPLIDDPITGALVAFVWNLFLFAQASLVGDYLRSNAERFGLD